MIRFYFHLYNDLDVRDEEGQAFPDLPAAIASATKQARALAAALITEQAGRIVLSHRIDIADARGHVLHTVRLADVLTITD